MIKNLFIFLITLFAIDLQGQSLQDYLQQVARNNPEIIAHEKLLEARRYEARTGNTPADPFISGSVMPGSPDQTGTMKTWGITQSFSFPSRYLRQKKMNNMTILLAEQEYSLGKLQIILAAKESYLDLVYKTTYLVKLRERMEGSSRLQAAWKKMLDNGETTVMDYNRIMMEMTDLKLMITRTQADIEMLQKQLSFYMGIEDSIVIPETYPVIPETDVEHVVQSKYAGHPRFLMPALEHELGLQEVKLSRAGNMPEFEIGYQSEIVPGETYTGPVAGMSIPLWSNSNRVKAASARAEQLAALKDATMMKLTSEARMEFSNMKALEKSISDIRDILRTGENARYLETALDAGEISLPTYFTYLEALYHTEDRLVELENELQKSAARVFDHELMYLYGN